MARRLTTNSGHTLRLTDLTFQERIGLLLGWWPQSGATVRWRTWEEFVAVAEQLDELPTTVDGGPGFATRVMAYVHEHGLPAFLALSSNEKSEVARRRPPAA